jgi:anionic cell wall polymer biosynthesis LytR-Cps2A-Psr (LCP) family protein
MVRISRQQALIRAVRSRLCTPSVALRIPGIVETIRRGMKSDLTTPQMLCLARFIKSLQHDGAITMRTIPTIKGDRIYVRADLDATRELAHHMFVDKTQ